MNLIATPHRSHLLAFAIPFHFEARSKSPVVYCTYQVPSANIYTGRALYVTSPQSIEPCSLTRVIAEEVEKKNTHTKQKWVQSSIYKRYWTTAPIPGSSHHLNQRPSLRRSAIPQVMTERMRISSFSSTVLVRTAFLLMTG